jgi:hypothetical protein
LADRDKVEGRKHEAREAPAIATILPQGPTAKEWPSQRGKG